MQTHENQVASVASLSNATSNDKDSAMSSLLSTHSLLSARSIRRFAPAYERTAAMHPVLCELPTLTHIARNLAARAGSASPPRPAVRRALVVLAQTAPDPVWSQLLIVAYQPLLRDLVEVGCAAGEDADERECEVVASFLEAVAEAPVHAESITLEIRERTLKRLAAHDVAERGWMEVILMADMSVFAAPEVAPTFELASQRRLSAGKASDTLVSDELLLRTFGEHGALAEIVRAFYAGAPEHEQKKAYQKLAQRRARLAKQIRRTRSAA